MTAATPVVPLSALLLLCRPGAEPDALTDLQEQAAELELAGFARLQPGQGWLCWEVLQGEPSLLSGRGLIWARTAWPVTARFRDLPATDRIGTLLPWLIPQAPYASVRLEHADTNAGRALQPFLRGFRKALERELVQRGLLAADGIGRRGAVAGGQHPDAATGSPTRPHLHLFFEDSCNGLVGWSQGHRASRWELGFPRLRVLAEAPSRSAAKLEEALLRLMTAAERAHWLRAGRTGVDLGACPGGWTWQLARHGVSMTGVDHGRLAPHLLSNYPVQHVSADAFTWRPPRPVDWLVCDIVDKPARTLQLMDRWLTQGWARVLVFNLKLPMKQRHATVTQLLERLRGRLEPQAWRLQAAQLYHDRDEVTVAVVPRLEPGAR